MRRRIRRLLRREAIRRRAFLQLLAASLLLSPKSNARVMTGRIGGGSPPGTEVGSGFTVTNTGSTGSNVPVRFGFPVARGDMAPTDTWVFKDESGNPLSVQIDQVSTRTALPGATDTAGVLHFVGSTQFASFTALATRTVHVYKQTGSYSPGTGLSLSAFTSGSTLQVKFKNVKNANGTTVGSGNFTCDINTYLGLGARTFAGGYDKTYDGAIQTTLEVLGRFKDDVGGATDPHLVFLGFLVGWQTTPGSGTLGVLEFAGDVSLPAINTTTTSPSLYWGDLEVWNGGTMLRAFTHSTTFAPSDVNLSGGVNFGTIGEITNTDGLQMGESLTFSTTGTLPSPLVAGNLYFAMEYADTTTGIPTPYSISRSTGAVYAVADYITLTSQGTGVHTVTRHSAINYRTAVHLFANDVGKPFVINPTGAVIYPVLTQAQTQYFQKSGFIPPFDFANASNADNPYVARFLACGNVYRHGSFAAQPPNVGSGGQHPGIGACSSWTAAWLLTANKASLDVVRATALGQASFLNTRVINEITGYMPAVDNGPDRAGGSYTKLGAPLPNLCWFGAGPVINNGFSTPIVPSYISTPAYWLDGMGAGVDIGKDHWPALGAATLYILTGDPWFLRTAQYDANWGLIVTYYPDSQLNRSWTSSATSVKYYGKLWQVGQVPRTFAWAMRDVLYAAMLGSDSDPQRAYFWNIFRENIDAAYDMTIKFYGGTDSNYATSGVYDTINVGQTLFMQTYSMGTISMMHMLTHYVSSILSGASTAWLRDYNTIFLARVWTTTGFTGFWAPIEWMQGYQGTTDFTFPIPPGHPPVIASAAGLAILNPYNNSTVDVTGKITPGVGSGGNPADGGGAITNGDIMYPCNWFNDTAVQKFGTGPLYVINSSNVDGSCQLSATPGGSAIVPSGLPASCDFGWQPQFTSTAPATWRGQNTSAGGYCVNADYGLNMVQIAGSTDTNLSSALANVVARTNATFSPYASDSWMQWRVKPGFVVP